MADNKTTTPASTTVKVSGQTGAAKDDLITGVSEDSASQNLNVLANDPGSAYLWSIDQNALNAPAGSQQPQYTSSVVTLASGARISVNADGTIKYVGAAALQSLQEGELFNDSFIYTIRMANGALSTARAQVQVVGKNDAATFSGAKTGSMTEDQSNIGGRLLVSDVDHDQSAMQASTQTGSNGKLVMAADGNWNFQLVKDMNYLQAGESVTETFTVKAVDGTVQTITITINGVNDAATFSGDKSGTLTEDDAAISGKLTASDLDHDQSAMQAAVIAGTNGNLGIDAAGNWNFTKTVNLDAMAQGESRTEGFSVKSVDGTAQAVTITINGVNDAPTVGAALAVSATEDGTDQTLNLLTGAADVDNGAVLGVTAVTGLQAGVSVAGNTLSVDADNAAFQHLGAGKTDSITVNYKVTDEFGASVAQQALVTVTGVNDAATFTGDNTGSLTENQTGTSGTLNATDVDDNESSLQAATLSGSNGNLSIDNAGNWAYGLTADLNALAQGESASDSFTVSSLDGTTATIAITINGVNDAPTVGAALAVNATEDAADQTLNLLGGAADVDHGAVLSVTAVTGLQAGVSVAGNTLSVDADNAAFQHLGAGKTDSITVNYKVTDEFGASVAQQALVTVTGVNDIATFSGAASGSVQEDGTLSASGTLLVHDADDNESAFASTGNTSGSYGSFSFDLQTGSWTYSLNNSAAAVQALASGQNVQDKLLVTSVDGSNTEILVTIGGQDEPVVVNPVKKWVVNKQNVTVGGGGLHSSVDDNGIARITGFDSNDELHYTSLEIETPFKQLVDTDNNGSLDSTLLNFSYEQGHTTHQVDVILVGYTGWSNTQLFHDTHGND